jgi:glycosyltransferase involved in cell wall biosynthesis
MTECSGTKSICFLITGLNVGGAEVQVVGIAKRLHSLGWKTDVISMLPIDGKLPDELRLGGVGVSSLNMRRGFPDPRAFVRLITILRRLRPAILHSHMVHANLLARAVRLVLRNPKLICTIHSVNDGGWWRQLAYRATNAIPELTTACSRAAAARFVQIRSVSPDKMLLLPNGIDVVRFQPNQNIRLSIRNSLNVKSQFVWLAVGRLDVPKDYPNMLRAFSRIRDADTQLLIAGTGPLHGEVDRLIKKLGIADKVQLLGFRSDIPELMNAADGYVMSSQWEGLPMVLLEAAATGLPIVATRAGGNDEVVVHRKSGVLVPSQDPYALATAMEQIMQMSDGQIISMRRAARQHVVANYSLDAIVSRWEAIYFDLLHRNGSTTVLQVWSQTAGASGQRASQVGCDLTTQGGDGMRIMPFRSIRQRRGA